MNTIKLEQLHKQAKVPTQATYGAACFDLYAVESAWISPGTTAKIGTGWAFEIPQGFCVEIHSRSGLAANHGIRLANNVGIIDADYRGEIIVALHNDSNQSYQVAAGERVAQFKLEPVLPTALMVVSELSDTERGLGGFGSTGAG